MRKWAKMGKWLCDWGLPISEEGREGMADEKWGGRSGEERLKGRKKREIKRREGERR